MMSINESPTSLFKFINLSKPEDDIQTIVDGIFVKSKLKITTPKYFNDRFDSRIILDKFHCRQILKEFDNMYPNNHKLNQSEIEFRALQLEASPILCLTANSPLDTSSDIMWGLYGGDGKGICIEFEYSKIFNIYKNIPNLLPEINVSYDDKFSKFEIFKNILKSHAEAEIKMASRQDFRTANMNVTRNSHKFHNTKHSNWSHENEYRLIDNGAFYSIMPKMKGDTIENKIKMAKLLSERNNYFISITNKPDILKLPKVDHSTRNEFLKMHVPIPKAIYLGFDIPYLSDRFWKIQYQIIHKYCVLNKVRLYVLTGKIDYKNNIFKNKTII